MFNLFCIVVLLSNSGLRALLIKHPLNLCHRYAVIVLLAHVEYVEANLILLLA